MVDKVTLKKTRVRALNLSSPFYICVSSCCTHWRPLYISCLLPLSKAPNPMLVCLFLFVVFSSSSFSLAFMGVLLCLLAFMFLFSARLLLLLGMKERGTLMSMLRVANFQYWITTTPKSHVILALIVLLPIVSPSPSLPSVSVWHFVLVLFFYLLLSPTRRKQR